MLESVVGKLEDVSEDLREHYTEVTGVGFVLQANQYVNDNVSYGLVDTKGLKSALDSEREINKGHKANATSLEAYSALGTPQDIQTKLTALSESGVKTDAQILAIEETYKAKLIEANKIGADNLATAHLANQGQAVTAMLSGKQGDIADGASDYFNGIVLSNTAVDDAGKTFIKNPDGTPRMTMAAGEVSTMSLDEFWSVVKADPKHAFALKPSGASGSGSSGSSGGGVVGGQPQNGADWNKMSKEDQKALFRTNPSRAGSLAQAGAKLI